MEELNKEESLSLKEIQSASLNVLDELANICKERGLRYSLAYGTLIGALRHKGFIPWDDDIDILMPRSDYEELKKYLTSTYNGELKWCDRASVKNYPYCISRVSDMRYKYYTTLPKQKKFDIGVFVDIYPLDNYCNTEKDALRLGKRCWFKNRLFDIYLNPNKTEGYIKIVLRNIISFFLHLIHGRNWEFYIDDEIKNIIEKNTARNNRLIGVISQYEWKEIMKKRWFENYIEVEFEGRKFMACKNYHEFLSNIYGDYMKLPNEKERVSSHNYKIIKRK